MTWRAWLRWRSPERFSRTRTVWPEEAGIGAAPPNIAKAASERQRPACDQAHSTVAATIGPTPGAGEEVGAPGPDQLQDGLAVVGGLGGQLPDPMSQLRKV